MTNKNKPTTTTPTTVTGKNTNQGKKSGNVNTNWSAGSQQTGSQQKGTPVAKPAASSQSGKPRTSNF
jgi:hypothetical protein